MLKELEELQRQAESELQKSSTEEEFLAVRTKYLGRKGILTKLLRGLANIEPELRPQVGNLSNEIKAALTAAIENALNARASLKKGEVLIRDRTDVTLPGRKVRFGKEHPVSLVCKDICDIFAGLGFSAVQGPEIELDYYNFEALNIPKDHPARDMQDTFYIEDNIVLRTHTSPVQIRVMEKQRPPIRILSPGKVYRPDSDISHTPMFHQIEGL
ncbi:MAG: tRNA ligase subunit PheS family protein, partial [Syntrophales bacterium]